MATSLHEGPANQLDLLIRAGNVSVFNSNLDPGAKLTARLCFYPRPLCPGPLSSVVK